MFIQRRLSRCFLDASQFFSVLLLTGARQVGKTTLLRTLAEPGRHFVSLDPMDARTKAAEDPRLFLADNPPPVIIDEIQYVPQLLPYIKEIVDDVRTTHPEKARGMYWLTGSQKFELMQNVSESLAGRIGVYDMFGLSNREFHGQESVPFLPGLFSAAGMPQKTPQEFFHDLWLGSFPELRCSPAPDQYWSVFFQSYVQTYLERDVRKLAQVADLSVFYAFLKAAAARSGQMLNYSDLARDSGISEPTAKRYMSILETSNIAKLVYPYKNNQSAPMISTPKMYFLDTGLMAYLTDWKTSEVLASGAAAGHFFETWCIAEILKSYAVNGLVPSLYYFRTKERNPSEIDVLIKENDTLYPVEIKKSATLNKNDVKQFTKLETFKMPIGTGALISLYPQISHIRENILSIPATML